MANVKILEKKQEIIDEIADKVKKSTSTIIFEYQGLTVSETNELRRKLRESGSDFKVYKNTLTKRALDSLKIDLGELEGPKAMAFGDDILAPVKTLSEFAKTHKALEIKIGVIEGERAELDLLQQLAATPDRDTLLTMFASGIMQTVREFAICLDLHSKNLEK